MFQAISAMPAALSETILDNFPCPILKIDRDFQLLYRNPAAVRFNVSAPQEAAHHCYEWIKLTQPCQYCPVARAFQSGQVEKQTKCQLSQDYQLVSFEQTAIPVRSHDGEIAYVLEVDLDTTPLMFQQWDNESNFVQTVFAFAELIGKRDSYTGHHSENTRNIALKLGQAMGLDATQLDDLSTTALLHDIGKIGIPESILLKKGSLTVQERKCIEEHPRLGYEVLCKITRFQHIADYILYHHEWFDGTGYPLGLSGNNIPLLSRILSVADVFEALSAERIYRQALPKAEALHIICQGSGSQFDHDVVDCLLQAAHKAEWDSWKTI